MDPWGCEQLAPWPERRLDLPVVPLLCIITGSTAGRPWSGAADRNTLGAWPPMLTSGAASRRSKFAMRTPSRWLVRVCRSTSSNGSWSREPRHHVGLSAGHRQRRNHWHRLRPASADAAGQGGARVARLSLGAHATEERQATEAALLVAGCCRRCRRAQRCTRRRSFRRRLTMSRRSCVVTEVPATSRRPRESRPTGAAAL
jgi:hypothetical protein